MLSANIDATHVLMVLYNEQLPIHASKLFLVLNLLFTLRLFSSFLIKLVELYAGTLITLMLHQHIEIFHGSLLHQEFRCTQTHKELEEHNTDSILKNS